MKATGLKRTIQGPTSARKERRTMRMSTALMCSQSMSSSASRLVPSPSIMGTSSSKLAAIAPTPHSEGSSSCKALHHLNSSVFEHVLSVAASEQVFPRSRSVLEQSVFF